MDEPQRPIDGSLKGAWVMAGAVRWNVVTRAYTVFHRNSQELTRILDRVRVDFAFSMQLSGDDTSETREFWDEVDQRLHNFLASAVSLVDHTRRLTKFFAPDVPDIVAKYERRNAIVTELDETSFLRDLRNYLLHFGVAPLLQTLNFNSGEDAETLDHLLKLNAVRLLEHHKWSAQSKRYLVGFADRDGPVLRDDVVVYATAMQDLFSWLFAQRIAIYNDPRINDRFRLKSSSDG